jgi:Na+/H+ antiporter NhaD/arsenite permease-like protein
MSQLVAVLLLVFIFALATWRNISMGAVAFVAAYFAGVFYFDLTAAEVASGFPGSMFITLLGVTYFFGIGRANGTVGQIVQSVVNAVRGNVVWIPWVFFLLAAGITASGALSIATYSILIPMGLAFARSHRISPLLMGLSILNGTNAGGFSPIAVYFTIVSGVLHDNGVEIEPIPIFIATFLVNVLLNVFCFFLLDGRVIMKNRLNRGQASPAPSIAAAPSNPTVWTHIQLVTIGLMICIIIGGVGFGLDVGFLALTAAVILAVVSPEDASRGLIEIGWGVILLIGGMVTYINMLDTAGVIDELAQSVAGIGTPLFAALLMLFIAAVVSAFASTNAMFVVLVPLAAPLLVAGDVSSVGFAIALCLSASVVDSSPFSTAGALVLANTDEHRQQRTFRGLAAWAFSMIGIAPVLTWIFFVVISS